MEEFCRLPGRGGRVGAGGGLAFWSKLNLGRLGWGFGMTKEIGIVFELLACLRPDVEVIVADGW